jgi:hypothetical protein
MEEFEKLVAESFQSDLAMSETGEESSASAAEENPDTDPETREITEARTEAGIETTPAEERSESVEHTVEPASTVTKVAS